MLFRAAAAKAALVVSLPLLPLFAQEQATEIDAQKAALEAKVKALTLQKKIEELVAKKEAFEKQEEARPTPATTDALMAATQAQLKILDLAKKIEDLRKQQAAVLHPPVSGLPTATPVPVPIKPLSPEDQEIERLKQQQETIRKQQEIQQLRKQNAAMQAATQLQPPIPSASPAPPQTGPRQPDKTKTPCTPVPKKASEWTCKHWGICRDDYGQVLNPCPANGQQPNKK